MANQSTQRKKISEAKDAIAGGISGLVANDMFHKTKHADPNRRRSPGLETVMKYLKGHHTLDVLNKVQKVIDNLYSHTGKPLKRVDIHRRVRDYC